MTVSEAIKQLQAMPRNAELMVASQGAGGTVPVERFELVNGTWIDVIYDVEKDGRD